jgi:hypothetical protein
VSWFVGGPVLERLPPRCAAVAFDLAIVGSVAIFAFVVLGMFWMPLGVAAVMYYCGGILVLGNAPGVCLFAPPEKRPQMNQPQMPQINQPQMSQMNQPQMPQMNQPQMPQINQPQMSQMSQPQMPQMNQAQMTQTT